MVPKIKKILYATDLSETAKYAFRYAADQAKHCDAMITIVYVMENMTPMIENQVKDMVGKEKWESLKLEKISYLTQQIKSKIEDFCTEMEASIDSCRLLVEDIRIGKGNPGEEILNASKEIGADMIVMGNYGHNIIQEALIGGSARTVVKNSEVPVLLIRLPKE